MTAQSPKNQVERDAPAPQNGGTRPVPDPTVLTTQMTLRELTSLREILEAQIQGHRDVDATRFTGIDRTLEHMQKSLDQRQQAIDAKVAQLQELHSERFDSISIQFKERDTRTDQAASTTKVAVDAALQAQKEAVGEQNKSSALAIAKSEAATMKQIDQIIALISATTNSQNDKVNDIKDRLTLIEGRKQGHGEGWGYIVGGVGLIGGIIAAIAATVALAARFN